MVQKYIIGIDGGGTKTLGRIEKLSTGESHTIQAGASSLSNDFANAQIVLKELIEKLLLKFEASALNVHVFIGVAGGGVANQANQLKDELPFAFASLDVVNDAKTSLYGANNGEPIAVVALGTGSVGARLDENGKEHYVGGWGFPIGDEASGAKLGFNAIQKLLSDMNWHNKAVSVTAIKLTEKLGNDKQQIANWLAQAQAKDYATLSADVFALHHSCPVANNLIEQHVADTEKLIQQTRLDSHVDVVIMGGLAQLTLPLLNDRIRAYCKLTGGSSLDGACFLAKQQLGNSSSDVIEQSKSSKYDNNERDSLLAQLDNMVSETRNPDTLDLDLIDTEQLLTKINQADAIVPGAIKTCIPEIGKAVEEIVNAFNKGGRLIYIGAGTSGRLGVLDAVECPPTFSVSSKQVVGIIAGGSQAIYKAVEGAEDSFELGKNDLININYNENDILVGIAASGRTPYVIGAIDYAKSIGTKTISISCNPSSQLASYCDINICAVVGPEVLTGSTRMKSGTAQKLILNMLSTASMIRIGKVYENLMVDVNASNKKLYVRAIRIVMQATGCDAHSAQVALDLTHYNAKLAIIHILTNDNIQDIQHELVRNGGFLRQALRSVKQASE